MLQSCAAPRGVGWGGERQGPSRRAEQRHGRGRRGSAGWPGVTGPSPSRSSDSAWPARADRVAVCGRPACSALQGTGAPSPAAAPPALTAVPGGHEARDSADLEMSLWKHISWRALWQIAQKAKNIPGVHGSEETGCSSRPSVRLACRPRAQWQPAFGQRWVHALFHAPIPSPKLEKSPRSVRRRDSAAARGGGPDPGQAVSPEKVTESCGRRPSLDPAGPEPGGSGGGGLLPFLLFGELRLLRALARSSSIAAAISGLSSPLYQTRSSSPGAIGCGERRDRRRANQSGGCWWGGGREGPRARGQPGRKGYQTLCGCGDGCGKEPSAGGRTSLPARFLSTVHQAIYGSERDCCKLKTATRCESYCSKPYDYPYRREKRKARNHFAHEM